MGEEEAGAVSGEAQGVGAASGRPRDEVAPARHQAATTTRRAVARPRTTRSGQRAGPGQGGVGAAPGDELAPARRGTRVLRGRHGVPGRGVRRRRAAAHAGEGRPGTGAAAHVDLNFVNFVECAREGIYGGSAWLVPAILTSRH